MLNSGMYNIYLLTNKVTGDSYAGFTVNISRRLKDHAYRAKRGSKTHFHNHIRKHGLENMRLTILEEGHDAQFGKNIREPYWIALLKPTLNSTIGGDGVLGYHHTDSTKTLMSKKRKGLTHSPSHNHAVSKSKQGKSFPNQIDSISRDWAVISPTGAAQTVHNLSSFCRKNNLSPGAMTMVHQGKRSHHKGWTVSALDTQNLP